MTKKASTLAAGDQTKARIVRGTDDKRQTIDLTPSKEAVEKIRRIEESFAMAEQNLGMLRVG